MLDFGGSFFLHITPPKTVMGSMGNPGKISQAEFPLGDLGT